VLPCDLFGSGATYAYVREYWLISSGPNPYLRYENIFAFLC